MEEQKAKNSQNDLEKEQVGETSTIKQILDYLNLVFK